MSAEGYTVDPKSAESVTSKIRKKPNNISELRSLPRLVGYFRKSIPNFSQLVKPLYLLLKDKDLKRLSKKLMEWTTDHKSIMDKLLTCLTEPPILVYPGSCGIYFLHLDTCVGGFQYLLVLTDHFTRYTQVYPTRNKEAKSAAEKLFNDYILRFRMPGKIIHDQGGEF